MFDLTLPASVAVLPVEPAHTHDPIIMDLEIGQDPSGGVIPPGSRLDIGQTPTGNSPPPGSRLEVGQDPGSNVPPPGSR